MKANTEIDYPLSSNNCALMNDLAMERFEEIIKEKNPDRILELFKIPDLGPFSHKGPFHPLLRAEMLRRLPHRWAPEWETKNDAITDEVMHMALNAFIKSFDDRWWKEWLDAALGILGRHGWHSREKGEDIGNYAEREVLYKKEEEIFAPRLKELYKKIMGLVLSHLDDSWIMSQHVADKIALLTYAFVAYAEWNEDPADYGISTGLMPLLRKSDYVDEVDIRRIENGKFNSRIEYLEWKLTSAEWPFREEGKCWIKPSELNGTTFHDVQVRLTAKREAVRKEVEEARKQERQ
jgi:hypothetical protein